MAPISGKYIIPTSYIDTKKVINAPNFISQSEPSAPKVIIVDNKMRTGASILSEGTGASVTPEKLIPKKKSNMKSPAMSPPRKDPIPTQDINRLISKKDKILPPHLAKYPPGFKLLINDAHDPNSTEYDRKYSIDNLRNEK